jgi:TusA-related sulfurtransferase
MAEDAASGKGHLPQALIDAGSEGWETLQAVVARRMDELLGGEVLEVVSGVAAVALALPTWCAGSGHEFLGVRTEGGASSFWIRKQTEERTKEG